MSAPSVLRLWVPALALALSGCTGLDATGARAPGVADAEAGFRANHVDLRASADDWIHFEVEVPAGAPELTVAIQGGAGDADLYLREGREPSLTDYDCRPYLEGNQEVCRIEAPAEGTWHIGLHAFVPFEDVDLRWSFGNVQVPSTAGGVTMLVDEPLTWGSKPCFGFEPTDPHGLMVATTTTGILFAGDPTFRGTSFNFCDSDERRECAIGLTSDFSFCVDNVDDYGRIQIAWHGGEMVLEDQVDSSTTLEVGPDARRLYVQVDAGTEVRLMRGPVVMSEGRDGKVYVENPVAGRWTLEVGQPTMARGSVTY